MFTLWASLNLKHICWDTFGEILSTQMTYIIGFSSICFPFICMYILFKFRNKLKRPENKETFGILYQDMSMRYLSTYSLLDPVVHQFRIIFIAIAYIFLEEYPIF